MLVGLLPMWFLFLESVIPPSPDGTGVAIVTMVATYFTYWLYEWALVAYWGRTLGKAACGISVVRSGFESVPGGIRSFARTLIPMAVLLLCFPLYPLTFIVACFPKDRRGVNDHISQTRVVARA